ncbi:uncharacterized protein DUF4399 [Bosea sp. AK1]|uniref:DUF4399 domain-containing protein n=1 Tax=Bosea sp. AK1 TaxID=2587160 RepID=UPI0011692E21|nr:DUF4399 domain-containing protein [Bosea sp. AK1]TQI74264.1 uncharacterized protein DUF4399 [Bosea sp. AK1]
MLRLAPALLLLGLAVALPFAGASAQDRARQRSPAPAAARLSFVGLADKAQVPAKLTVRFAISGMEVVPAGQAMRNAGHHHLLIDTELPPLDQPIPSDFNHIHFGGGQTEAEIALTPGKHTLQLLFADHNHVPHDPPVVSERITVEVSTAPEKPRSVAAPGARVFFIDLQDGATIPSRAKIRFGAEGISVTPAGTTSANGGHHHLLVDTELPALDREIPSDFNHLHFGRGQTEVELSLPPGDHTLQLLMGDHEHVPHDPPVVSPRIRVRVVGDAQASVAAPPPPHAHGPDRARTASPNDAAVYFVYPRDGDRIYPTSTIRFGLRNMGVAPAGVAKPNTGHHHLLVDAGPPSFDEPIPADLNHIHLGGGQTEYKLTLPNGRHTLQLLLADENHLPHDPPVISERITVTVVPGGPNARRRR